MKSRKTISAAKLHSPAKKGKGVSVEKTANKPVSRRKSLRVQGKTAKPVPVLDSQKEPRAKVRRFGGTGLLYCCCCCWCLRIEENVVLQPKGEKFESKAAEDHPMSIPTSAAPAEDRPGPGAEVGVRVGFLCSLYYR